MGRKTAYLVIGMGLLASFTYLIALFLPLSSVNMSFAGLPFASIAHIELYTAWLTWRGWTADIANRLNFSSLRGQQVPEHLRAMEKRGHGDYTDSLQKMVDAFCTQTMQMLWPGPCDAFYKAYIIGMLLITSIAVNILLVQGFGSYLLYDYATRKPSKKTRTCVSVLLSSGTISQAVILLMYSLMVAAELDALSGFLLGVIQTPNDSGFSSGQFVMYVALVFQIAQVCCLGVIKASDEDRFEAWKLERDEHRDLFGDYGATWKDGAWGGPGDGDQGAAQRSPHVESSGQWQGGGVGVPGAAGFGPGALVFTLAPDLAGTAQAAHFGLRAPAAPPSAVLAASVPSAAPMAMAPPPMMLDQPQPVFHQSPVPTPQQCWGYNVQGPVSYF
eukprot:CAMPEP_0198501764 /NCGR_PEP_ID=MMETSP1462-20131121/8901_1 /TAXON_ID=1333877 /ORGANISM="Brandtodinium nutriculum, Strain RCC3387" /LENGTH=386 /DNA_ID=CAMNT_0044230821 /DNA_START=104 /DNA_END=1264 /DNA_ORIENTATION=-